MRKIQYILTLITTLLFATGCEHHHLYYAWKNTVKVRVNLDWSKADLWFIENKNHTFVASPNIPNGVTIAIYFSKTGELYKEYNHHNTEVQDMELPEGVYDILIFNNSKRDLYDISFAGAENKQTHFAYSEKTDLNHNGITMVQEPNDISSVLLEDVVVTKEDIDIFYNQPSVNEQDKVFKEFTLYPLRRVEEVILHAKIKGLKYAYLPPYVWIGNFSEGYYLGQEKKSEEYSEAVVHNFPLNNRWFDPETSNIDGTLTHRFNTFGVFSDDTKEYPIDLKFNLLDGSEYEVPTITIKREDIKWVKDEPDGVWKHYIEIEFELPAVIGGGTGGGFDTNTEDWNDVVLDLDL